MNSVAFALKAATAGERAGDSAHAVALEQR
jgi:hypothetical protein